MCRSTLRRSTPVGLLISAILLVVTALAPSASAGVASPCRVRNLNSDVPNTDLQDAINDATAGDLLRVKGTCVGNFTISKDLRLRGAAGGNAGVLDGNDAGTTVEVTSGVVVLRRLTITGGSGQFGAGILNWDTLTIRNSTITDNHSPNGHGGGILNRETMVLNGTTVSGNSADGVGGGIDNQAGTLTLNGSSSVTGNAAEWGGGIGNGQQFGSTATLTLNDSSTVSGNTATLDGGGIDNEKGTVTMNDGSTVTGNRADFDDDANGTGGGIFNCSTLVGATDGGNVNDNFLGSTGITENNIVTCV